MKKADIIYACSTVLEEYENRTHDCSFNCPLCLLLGGSKEKGIEPDCCFCIMNIFSTNPSKTVGCLYRNCYPVSFPRDFVDKQKISAVTEFYRRMLPWLRELSEEEINNFSVLEHLKDIDYHVALEHGLISQ